MLDFGHNYILEEPEKWTSILPEPPSPHVHFHSLSLRKPSPLQVDVLCTQSHREFVEWKANLLCISLSASAPWRMWGNTTSISCSAESGESLPVQRIQSNWEILENLLFQKHYTQCMMWIVTQQHFQRAKFSPLMHASLYRWRAAALIHVLLSFFKLATCHCHAPYNALPASHCNA